MAVEKSDFLAYRPDFPPEEWSKRDLDFLEPFATNPQGFVSVIRNLPPEVVGALCSRASRAKNSLLRVLLDEYIYAIVDGEDEKLAGELIQTIDFLKIHGFKNILNNQRAQEFYARWLSQYGDDSIAQMTGTHIVYWGISQVAMKFLEDQRVGLEPIEKSTRYVNFGNKIDGRYLYYIPRPDLENLNLLGEYQDTLDRMFDTYTKLLPQLIDWLTKNYKDKKSILEKKAFDTLRGLLPMATLGQVAFRGNAQAFEYLINRTAAHNLGEFRWIAGATKTELDKEIPSLLLRLKDEKSINYQKYLSGRREKIRKCLNDIVDNEVESIGQPQVKLIESDPDIENKIIAGIIFPENHVSWEACLDKARRFSISDRKKIIDEYFSGRSARWYKVGRALENSYFRFEIIMNIGGYRDLHRHRMMTQDRQLFSTHHGYDLPVELRESGLASEFESVMILAKKLFDKIEKSDPDLAQYVVPLAYRMRFYQWQNIRQLFWETELRTISQGHPDYRHIEQEKYRLAKERIPLISEFLLADMGNYSIARRGTDKKIKDKEKRIIEGLRDKE